eukprot:RCo004597
MASSPILDHRFSFQLPSVSRLVLTSPKHGLVVLALGNSLHVFSEKALAERWASDATEGEEEAPMPEALFVVKFPPTSSVADSDEAGPVICAAEFSRAQPNKLVVAMGAQIFNVELSSSPAPGFQLTPAFTAGSRIVCCGWLGTGAVFALEHAGGALHLVQPLPLAGDSGRCLGSGYSTACANPKGSRLAAADAKGVEIFSSEGHSLSRIPYSQPTLTLSWFTDDSWATVSTSPDSEPGASEFPVTVEIHHFDENTFTPTCGPTPVNVGPLTAEVQQGWAEG